MKKRIGFIAMSGIRAQDSELLKLGLMRDAGCQQVLVTLLTPFPGTPLYRRLTEEGRILKHAAWDRCTLFDINFQPRRMTPAQLREGFHDLVRRLYSEEETASRRRGFRQRLRGKASLPVAVPA